MGLKNNVLNIDIKPKNPQYDAKKTAQKFAYGSILVFILQVILNYLQTSQEPLLEVTVKSLAVGVVMAAINYIKNKGGKR